MTTPDPKKSSGSSLDSKLEAEIEAALGDMSLDDMMDVSDTKRAAPAAAHKSGGGAGGSQREEKTGLIVDIRGKEVYVEFGPKSQGICPLDHFSEPPKPGTKENFLVDRYDKNEGMLILTKPGSVQKAEWESLEIGQTVEARCTGVNKGGLEMEIAKHRAFMPAGQVDVRHIAELEVFVGEKMPCEVIELDRQRGRIILSRRSVLEAERGRLRENLLENLEVGHQLPAVITSIQPYGAFADLGGMDGLIHISDLSYERINDPSEVVKEGDQVEVRVLKIDTSQDPPRIGLGLKQTMSDPYQEKAGAISEGDEVTGKVTKLMAFGAFVELSPGVEGLIHISELSHERVHKVSSVVKPGEVVKVKVVSVDHNNRRIGLSLKQMTSQEQSENFDRGEDPEMRKLKAQLSEKFGELKGGLG
ncbi:MAG: S1 RNA-binding domain-containing protein [Phycisphaerales bacterium]|nr:MAG: S1 RNA-binding domain-containing protein [Phycisphaerales bacterium]